MTLRALFVGADGRAHPPWRLLLFLVLTVACIIVVMIGLRPVLEGVERITGIEGTAEAYGMTLALLLAHWMTLRTFDQRPASLVWLHREAARPGLLAYGGLLGGTPIAVTSLLLLGAGLLVILPAPDGPWLVAAIQIGLFLLPAAFYEELLSRGYVLATLAAWLGRGWAVLLTSVGFGLLHLANPGDTPMSIGIVMLAGVYLAAILLATRSLYAATIAHWAWNWVMAAVLHVPVSGLPLSRPNYQIVDNGPDWITGGAWGPEGGAGAAAAMIAGLAFLFWKNSGRLREIGSRHGEAESLEPQRPQPTAHSPTPPNDHLER